MTTSQLLRLSFLSLLIGANAFALETKVKRAAFSDCAALEQQVPTLNSEDRQQLVKYLGRVLRMETDAVSEVVNEPSLPVSPHSPSANPLEGFDDRSIWRTFTPTRELEAKRCAIRSLGTILPDSMNAIPSLIGFARGSSLIGDLRKSAADVAWQIAVAIGRNPEWQPGAELILALITMREQDDHYLAENILVEFHRSALPLLVQRLKSAEPALRGRYTNLLLRIDPNGDLIGDSLLPLLQTADRDLQTRTLNLFAELPAFSARSFPAIVQHLEDPSSEVSDAARGALVRILQSGAVVSPSEAECEIFGRKFEQISRDAPMQVAVALEPAMLQCVRGFERFYQQALGPLKSTIPVVRKQALRLLSGLLQDGTYRQELFNQLLDATSDPDVVVRVEAIRALGRDRVRQKEVHKAFTRILRRLSKELTPWARREVILSIAEAIDSQDGNQGGEIVAPYLGEVFGAVGDSVAPGEPLAFAPIRLFVERGAAAIPALMHILQGTDALARSRALIALGAIKPVEAPTVRAAVSSIADPSPDVRQQARNLLIQNDSERMRSEVQKIMRQRSADVLTLSEVLAQVGVRTAAGEKAFLGRVKSAPCVEVGALLERFPGYELVDPTAQFERIIACLPEVREVDGLLSALQRLKAPGTSDRLQGLLGLPDRLSVEQQVLLLGKANDLGLVPAFVATKAQQLIASVNNPTRIRLIDVLAKLGPSAGEAVDTLYSIINDAGGDQLVQLHAAVAITLVAPERIGAGTFKNARYDGNARSWAGVVKSLPDVYLVPLLGEMLVSTNEPLRRRALETAKLVGVRGAALRPQIEALSQGEDSELAHEATLALLAIAPTSAELALRRDLVGPHARSLVGEEWNAEQLAVLQRVSNEPRSFTEMRAAQRILRKKTNAN